MIANVGDVIRVVGDNLHPTGAYESVVLTAAFDEEFGIEYYGVEVPMVECGCFAYHPYCGECYWLSSATSYLHTVTLVERAAPGWAERVKAHVADLTARGVHVFHA